MNVETIIADFNRRGIHLVPRPPKLAITPASLLTDADRALLRAHKGELLAALMARENSSDGQSGERPIVPLAGLRNQIERELGATFVGIKPRKWLPDSDPILDEPISSRPNVEHQIDSAVRAELERIWPEAERLGWSQRRIWGANFWPVDQRGLAALLDSGDRIVKVTEAVITIEKADRRHTSQRFWRHDA